MRGKTFLWGISLAFLSCVISLEGAYASAGSTRVGIHLDTRRGSDDNGHHHHGRHKYYKRHRYYPHDYYYYKKIYYFPLKRYYFYYDIYPEKINYYESEKKTYTVNPHYLPITSIANMASQGVPDAVIISEIERTHSGYRLSSEIITYLKQNSVSDRVIDVMIATEKR